MQSIKIKLKIKIKIKIKSKIVEGLARELL